MMKYKIAKEPYIHAIFKLALAWPEEPYVAKIENYMILIYLPILSVYSEFHSCMRNRNSYIFETFHCINCAYTKTSTQ